MKQPTRCPYCHLTYDRALISICPYCGKSPLPPDCPDPLCILDLNDPAVCQSCPRKPQPHPGWGGRRTGAGAPQGNLNRLVHGGQSRLLKKGIARMAEDPELRAVLLIIARLAAQGEVPPKTKRAITTAIRHQEKEDAQLPPFHHNPHFARQGVNHE